MKTTMITKPIVTLLGVLVLAGFTACTTDTVERLGGKLPDKDGLENTYGMLRSSKVAGNETRLLLTRGSDGFVTDNIFYQITRQTPEKLSLDVRVDETLLEAYNQTNDTDYMLLPEGNYDFPDGRTLTLDPSDKRSDGKRIRVYVRELPAGNYLLPLTVVTADAESAGKWQTIYYKVVVREPYVGEFELNDDQVYLVCYINTNTYQPLLVNDYCMEKLDTWVTWEQVWYRTIGNLINLRTVVLDYDAVTNRAMLKLGSDMRYVLDHAVKYIRPLQEKGRKVCISLEGGGTGLGFCNMTDMQIADFVAQVKAVVEMYEIDGINLWDRNSGYGQEGMPAVNTTSYPKLIKAMHDMLKAIGSDKLLTLTDHLAPTEYFWDTEATGGIEVGGYLDMAWSGYCDNALRTQIVDPWHPDAVDEQGNPVVSEFGRKPIAGLDPSRYGCINAPWYTGNATPEQTAYLHVYYWRKAGCKQSDILVFEDLRTVLQDAYEGSWDGRFTLMYNSFSDDGIFAVNNWGTEEEPMWFEDAYNGYYLDVTRLALEDGKNTYNKWLKDW